MMLLVPLLIVLVGAYILVPRKPSFTLYYSDRCSHCHDILPVFSAFQFPGVVIRAVESKWNNECAVSAFPTWVYRDVNGTQTVFAGERTPQAWTAFLQQQNHQPDVE